ncbi:MAG: DUF3572 domain-containing protein [Hyphomicrobiaceae bacterium]
MRKNSTDADAASTTALKALAFLAGEPERLARFLALTGIGPQDLRARAGERDLHAAVLEHLMTDETLLLMFAADAGMPAEAIADAHTALTMPAGRRQGL